MKKIKIIAIVAMACISFFVINNSLNNKKKINFEPLEYQSISSDLILQNKISYKTENGEKEGGPNERLEFEFLKRRSPITNEIPNGIRRSELNFAQAIDASSNLRVANAGLEFTLRGPFNVGGRTRALHLDVNRDSTILAGGVSGGMWKTIDFGQSWTKTTTVDQLANATCVEQDARDGNTNVWYYGTGEISGNSAGKSGAPYRGDGIYKSIDGGDSWTLIQATSTGGITSFDSPFKYISRMLINPLNTNEREIYAAVDGGIIRTTNDFETYEYVLGDENGGDFNDIAMTSEGVFYATLNGTSGDEDAGIFTSTDGMSWTEITPYDDSYRSQRIVIGIAKSNEDSVYFHAAGNSYRIDLYKADTDEWTDLSNNIPSFGDPVGNLSQGRYNMFIKVHPLDSRVVYIGSTNVYRSTDGFTSTDNITWIGGYDDVNNVSTYPNHHPDQHNLVFLSSDGNRMITSNDGGVQVTLDNLAEEVEWTSLNNGYITSQFYSAAINLQDPGDNRLLGGLQDNSSWYGTSSDPDADWQDIWSGDGCFSAITYNSLYVTTQNLGSFYRYAFDENGEQGRQGRLFAPASNYLFVNPWVEDPVDPNRLYIAGDGEVFYSLDGTEFPGANDWLTLSPSSSLPDENVSAIGVSSEPAHVVYVGMANGQLFLMPNSSDNAQQMVEITGSDFPEDGYINCVEVDEHDASRAIVVFTNYEVVSVFMTEDGGTTWAPISGNLEENEDGSGAGVGVNWAESIRLSDGSYYYLLGTNTGLYGTDLIDGMNTVWSKISQSTIGNTVVDMIRVRSSDGYVIVGTHGNGMYEATFDKDFELTVSKIGSLTICEGETLTLRAGRSNNFNYQWFKDGSPIDEANSHIYEVATGGEFYVTAEVEGETFTSRSFTTTFNGRPDGTLTINENIISVPTCDNCNYNWIDGSGNTLFEGSNILDITTISEVPIRVLITNDCFTAQSERIELFTLGFTDANNISVFPNPAMDYLFINSNLGKVNSIEVFDMKGLRLKKFVRKNNESKFDISGIRSGLILIRINMDNGNTQTFKIYKN